VRLIISSTLPMFKTIQMTLDAMLLRVSENLEGVRVIRAFHTGEREREKFSERADELYGWQIRAGSVQALLNPLTYVTVNLGVVFLLWYASVRVNAGLLLQGEVVALCNYMSQILVELVKFANLVTLVTRGLASAARVEGIMDMKADEREHLTPDPEKTAADRVPAVRIKDAPGLPVETAGGRGDLSGADFFAIEFKDVTFAYGEGEDATLEHISFYVRQGQTLGIIGGTGAGKSTIARLMRHAYDADRGQVLLFGKDVRTFSDDEMAKTVANVPQKASLIAGDIAANLRLGKQDAAEDALWEALARAQAKDFVEERNGQLYAEVAKKGANFSGGQRQRLTIARALCVGAPVLILDDAASALDLATESRLKTALDEMTGVTKVIISQRASSVRNADKIIVIEDGWCVGDGTHEELLEKCDIYQEIYYAQYPEEEQSSLGA
ncbi:MAG: ABC transporter ATP-binding protein, partial [Lachnospiraceae bacterium]|nr:ABC transporter ATP-binding protein [Lachnospiraceae bacterium]